MSLKRGENERETIKSAFKKKKVEREGIQFALFSINLITSVFSSKETNVMSNLPF